MICDRAHAASVKRRTLEHQSLAQVAAEAAPPTPTLGLTPLSTVTSSSGNSTGIGSPALRAETKCIAHAKPCTERRPSSSGPQSCQRRSISLLGTSDFESTSWASASITNLSPPGTRVEKSMVYISKRSTVTSHGEATGPVENVLLPSHEACRADPKPGRPPEPNRFREAQG